VTVPTKNGIRLSDGVLFTENGEMVRLQDIGDETITEGPELTRSDAIDFWTGQWSGTVVLTRSFMRTMMRMVYGWRAKGPIRKRVLHRLWRAFGWQD
jgi:hypothetical protein